MTRTEKAELLVIVERWEQRANRDGADLRDCAADIRTWLINSAGDTDLPKPDDS